ncbi:MAG TPA: type II toxin-antitoxin system VapC family toxin [Candidatus Acidoferrales bacterium]|jgi:predicted nucleic acid-binding protein|nr:type II toxin-antitoxin system VapC family toxin [Candidatus Acidoferrales bacterium]
MSRVFWDTNLFIYLFEGYGPLAERVVALRQVMLARGDQLITSTLTLGEILVKPIERKDAELSRKYEEAVTAAALLIPFDLKAAKIYAALRCDRSLRAPDAMQLACAASVGVDLFITNDARLHSMQVPGIQFIVPLDRSPF